MGKLLKQMSRIDRAFYKIDREKIWKKQNKKCYYCKNHLSKSELTMDHVIPLEKTRYHSTANCVVSCSNCNGKKSNKVSYIPEEKKEWEILLENGLQKLELMTRKIEYRFSNDSKGSFNKWQKYWEKRGKWDNPRI